MLRRASVREQVERGRGEGLRPADRRPDLRSEIQRGSCAVSRVDVAVAVADDAQGRIYEVAAACRALGMDHTTTLATVGVLTGSMESDELVKLLAVPGVLAVEVKCELRSGITGTIQ
jgi:hypothetical protein